MTLFMLCENHTPHKERGVHHVEFNTSGFPFEQLDNLGVTFVACNLHGRDPMPITMTRIGLHLQQLAHDPWPPGGARKNQGSVPVRVRAMDVCPSFEQFLDDV